MEWFEGLDREQVKAVIAFAARSLDRPQPTPPKCGFSSTRRRRSRFCANRRPNDVPLDTPNKRSIFSRGGTYANQCQCSFRS